MGKRKAEKSKKQENEPTIYKKIKIEKSISLSSSLDNSIDEESSSLLEDNASSFIGMIQNTIKQKGNNTTIINSKTEKQIQIEKQEDRNKMMLLSQIRQQVEERVQQVNKQFEDSTKVNIECMAHQDDFCIIEALLKNMPLYICKSQIHKGKYLCNEAKKKVQNCRECSVGDLVEIDPFHRNNYLGNILTCKYCRNLITVSDFYNHLTAATHENPPNNFHQLDTFRYFQQIYIEIIKNQIELSKSSIDEIYAWMKKRIKALGLNKNSMLLCFESDNWGCLLNNKKSDIFNLKLDKKTIVMIRLINNKDNQQEQVLLPSSTKNSNNNNNNSINNKRNNTQIITEQNKINTNNNNKIYNLNDAGILEQNI